MSLQGVQRAWQQMAGGGYLNWMGAYQIEKAALENDNTVTAEEKKFLQDHYQPGLSDPQANYIFQQLMSWGERSVVQEMDELRLKKQRLHLTNSEYVEQAKPILLNSSDTIANRMAQLRRLKTEASLWNSEFSDLGKQLFLNSHDPIYNQMEALHTFKIEASMWNSEYKELGTQVLVQSFDRREERLLAAEHFRVEAGLWQSELQDIQKKIYDDQYWDPKGQA